MYSYVGGMTLIIIWVCTLTLNPQRNGGRHDGNGIVCTYSYAGGMVLIIVWVNPNPNPNPEGNGNGGRNDDNGIVVGVEKTADQKPLSPAGQICHTGHLTHAHGFQSINHLFPKEETFSDNIACGKTYNPRAASLNLREVHRIRIQDICESALES